MSQEITRSVGLIPNMLWHQTKKEVYISIETPDAYAQHISSSCCWNMNDNTIHFQSSSSDKKVVYEFNQELHHSVASLSNTIDNGSKYNIILQKNNDDQEWSRLFADPIFNRCHVKINWNCWNSYEDGSESYDESHDESVDSEELQEMIKSGVLDEMTGLSSSSEENDEDEELDKPSLLQT